jgi:hypothetical protein
VESLTASGPSWFLSFWVNERIREDLRQGIENRLIKRQLKWYGHVVRMGEDRKPKQLSKTRRRKTKRKTDKEL